MTRRRLTIVLHWSVLLSLLPLLSAGPHPLAAAVFVICALAMTGLALMFGVMSGPGPKLEGAMRMAHPWMHRALYAFLMLVAVLTLADMFGVTKDSDLTRLYAYLIAASALHAIFHLWRHTALNDGALRRMTPRALHGVL